LTRLRVRLLILGLSTALAVVAVSGRLLWVTFVLGDSLRARGELQQQQTLKLDARRGTVLDRNGRELAVSVEVESVYAVPTALTGSEAREAAARLGNCLGVSKSRIAARLEGKKNFVWLERKADPETVRCVRALNIAGVGFLEESRRFYPKRRLASQILGYVGIDNEGMGGVEYALQDEIKGDPGRRIIWTDALRRRAGSWVDKPSVPGRSVYLTIDENIQYIAETELAAAVRESRSKSGIAILMRPHTGELLALASYPSFNPNRYQDSPEGYRRNRSVTDVYEPGSTFKIVAASAALEEGVVTEDERIDCGSGSIAIEDHLIRDGHPFDVLSFREVVQKSSNVGMIRIGQRLGKERFEAYIRAFGFGDPTGIELPAESRGILRPSSSWGPVSAASITFGQEVSVTALQMITAANVVAASGYLMRPRLVLAFGASEGAGRAAVRPEPVRRVLREETARRMRDILTGAVDEGTGQRASIEGYRVAGKTGTAQKAVLGGYSKSEYIASFVGFAPANRPEITALVILDSPQGDHSGSRAASVFARVVERALSYLGVQRDDESVARFAKVWPQSAPILGAPTLSAPGSVLMEVGASSKATGSPARSRTVEAPDVLGLPSRDALARFVAAGLVPDLVGEGYVVNQSPLPRDTIEPGARARLVLAPSPPDGIEPPPEPARETGAVRVARAFGAEPILLKR
jgi:cell division protein FtsI/penicillin-binding protein 2